MTDHRTGDRLPRVSGRRSARRASLSVLLMAALGTGCYAYHPVATVPEPGMRVALELSDEGRVSMRKLIGPEVVRLEGALVVTSDTAYEIRVAETVAAHGVHHRWNGEAVSVRREYVWNVTERRLSRPRTYGALLGGATALVAFVITRDLFGLGGSGTDRVPPGGNGEEN